MPETLEGVRDLDDRYGRKPNSKPRWLWPAIATVGISAGIAWAAWAAWSETPVFQAEVFAYDVIDDQNIAISLDVYRDEAIALTCTVYAQAHDKMIVGQKSVAIPAENKEHTRVKVDVKTERRAVTGRLESCKPS